MTVRGRAVFAAVALTLALAAPAWSVQPDEMLDDPALEARAREISRDVRCPVCQGETIDDSNAAISRDLRIIIRERLVAGDTNEEVIDFLVARYGEFVLFDPPKTGINLVLWLAGPAMLLAGGDCRDRDPPPPGHGGRGAFARGTGPAGPHPEGLSRGKFLRRNLQIFRKDLRRAGRGRGDAASGLAFAVVPGIFAGTRGGADAVHNDHGHRGGRRRHHRAEPPEVMNALSRALRLEMREALAALQARVRCIVITGTGRAFCSGQDLQDAQALGAVDFERILNEEYVPLLRLITDSPVPTIAAVNGAAAGAGRTWRWPATW